MSYITSKKTFPVAMIGFPLTEKAIRALSEHADSIEDSI